MSEKKKVLVVGASGYSGQELLRFLLMHPAVELCGVTSRANAGTALSAVFPRFRGHAVADGLKFMMPVVDEIVAMPRSAPP